MHRRRRRDSNQKGRSFKRVTTPLDRAKADWSVGNPLTYEDPLARAYGKKRWGLIEGFHGTLERRFGLIKGKRWIRDLDRAELEVTMTYAIIHQLHGLAREIRDADAASSSGAPPGSP